MQRRRDKPRGDKSFRETDSSRREYLNAESSSDEGDRPISKIYDEKPLFAIGIIKLPLIRHRVRSIVRVEKNKISVYNFVQLEKKKYNFHPGHTR